MAVMQMIAFKEEDLERSKARCRDGFSLAQATPAKLAQEGATLFFGRGFMYLQNKAWSLNAIRCANTKKYSCKVESTRNPDICGRGQATVSPGKASLTILV